MKYLFINDLGELYCDKNGSVVEFENCYECSKYYDKNKLKDLGYSIVVEGIDKEKNNECLRYLK